MLNFQEYGALSHEANAVQLLLDREFPWAFPNNSQADGTCRLVLVMATLGTLQILHRQTFGCGAMETLSY